MSQPNRALERDLWRQVDRLASTVTLTRGTEPAGGPHEAAVQRQQIAAAWVFTSALAAWAEDHQLAEPLLRDTGLVAQMNDASGCLWLMRAMAALTVHPATKWLMHRGYNPGLWAGTPSPSACAGLVRWWCKDAPSLAADDGDGPPSIVGYLPGDLLQLLSPERRKAHALAQTPWWVADFLLARTLVPAAVDRQGGLLRTIDPCCGTGHILIRAVDLLWEWYTTGTMTPRCTSTPAATGGTVHDPLTAVLMVRDSLDGCELDPLTAAVARLRVTVYLAHLAATAGALPGPLRLATIPAALTPRIAVGDSLLLGVTTRADYAAVHPHLAELEGAIPDGLTVAWPDQPSVVAESGPQESTEPVQLTLL